MEDTIKKLTSFLVMTGFGFFISFFVFDYDFKYIKNFGVSVPQDKQEIIGVWRHEGSVIEIQSTGQWLSSFKSGGSSKTHNSKIQDISEKHIRVGFSAMGFSHQTFGLPETHEDGKVTWIINNQVFEKTGDRLPASERESLTNEKKNRKERKRRKRRKLLNKH